MPKESGTGKYFNFLKNFFTNGLGLCKALCTETSLYWGWNLGKLDNCKVDTLSVLNKPYSLRGCSIAMGTAIGPNARISEASIGKFCSIGPNFLCGWGIHPTDGISTSPAFYSTKKQAGFTYSRHDKIIEHRPITIGNDVFIGANVTILDGVVIGDGAVIGAGAVVSKNIPPYAIAVGCPVKIVKYRFEPDVIEKLLEIQWWNGDDAIFKKVEANFFDVHAFIRQMDRSKNKHPEIA